MVELSFLARALSWALGPPLLEPLAMQQLLQKDMPLVVAMAGKLYLLLEVVAAPSLPALRSTWALKRQLPAKQAARQAVQVVIIIVAAVAVAEQA